MSNFEMELQSVDDLGPYRTPLFKSITDRGPRFGKAVLVILGVLAALLSISGVVGYLYFQGLKQTPQYSLAMLVDAAKRDDKRALEDFIDIDAIVEDFIPQITDKAIEMYGRGLSKPTLERVAKLATPILPAVKDRARDELPRVIRERTARFGYVPFFAMVLGAEQYLDIRIYGDIAIVTSKLPEHSLELRMKREGARWRIVGVNDDRLATEIARRLGQEIIEIASKGLNKKTAETLGVGNLADLLRQAEELVK